MNNFLKHTIMGIVGVLIACITVFIFSIITDKSMDDLVGWIALGIAGASTMTKKDLY